MTNKREPPSSTTEMPFHEAVLGAAKLLQCNITEFANSIGGIDASEVNRWLSFDERQFRKIEQSERQSLLDKYTSIAETSFRFNEELLYRRILITRLNYCNELLQKHFGSELAIEVFLDSPWLTSDSKSWRQLAVEVRGLAHACDELEQWLINNTESRL